MVRRITALLLCCCMALFLAACGASSESNTAAKPDPPATKGVAGEYCGSYYTSDEQFDYTLKLNDDGTGTFIGDGIYRKVVYKQGKSTVTAYLLFDIPEDEVSKIPEIEIVCAEFVLVSETKSAYMTKAESVKADNADSVDGGKGREVVDDHWIIRSSKLDATWNYDAMWNMVSYSEYGSDEQLDIATLVESFDTEQRLLSRTWHYDNGDFAGSVEYEYDSLGRHTLYKNTDENHALTTWLKAEYHSDGRETITSYYENGAIKCISECNKSGTELPENIAGDFRDYLDHYTEYAENGSTIREWGRNSSGILVDLLTGEKI